MLVDNTNAIAIKKVWAISTTENPRCDPVKAGTGNQPSEHEESN